MKKNSVFVLALCSAVLFTGCKSRESAYRQAYEQAMAQDNSLKNEQQAQVTTPSNTQTQEQQVVTTTVVPVTPVKKVEVVDHSDVREIQGELSVVSGNPLKTYSVVVGSFVTQANAENQKSRLQEQGYDSRIVKTNETINGQTGWFRVIASSYDDKGSAVQSRETLKGNYPGAWLLYRR